MITNFDKLCGELEKQELEVIFIILSCIIGYGNE